MPPLRVIISGGGTGGHIFPAIAIAKAIQAKQPDATFQFVGAKGKMEMEKVPAAGFPIEALWISGLKRSLTVDNLSFPLKLVSSMIRARKLVRQFKPHVAVGTGGFASGPTVRAAMAAGVPAVIQEQNSYPGITNRLLAKKAARICVAYDGMDAFFPKSKLLLTGNPVRQEVVTIAGKREEARTFFGLQQDKPTLLIVGGSLGARSVNQAVMDGLQDLANAGIQVVWQTGKHSYQQAVEAVQSSGVEGIIVKEFITKMDLAYAAADLVISRAGAIAVSELCLVKKPCILVPFPFAAEDHQTKNAQAVVNKGAAILVKDEEAGTKLVQLAIDTLQNETKRQQLETNMAGLGIPDSAERIAEEVIKLAGH